MEATFATRSGLLTIADVPSEQVARLVAACCGFRDLDVEPMEDSSAKGPGKVRITATGPNRTVTVTGTTVYDACDNLIDQLVGEKIRHAV